MTKPPQLELRLRYTPAEQSRSVLARLFRCEALGCSLLPEACVARQDGDPAAHPTCVDGRCEQGLRVKARLGLIGPARCPCCVGAGRIDGRRCPCCAGSGRVRAERIGP